ncbi:hypothetical protein K2173_022065 [Erythroxylum novogranatense]|uniref:ascorbate ferrireductase (transmembrane) n=1 Tax=Erythroxylum novogranatense TaxID=1862640 RepID=A0AAV8T2X0_9ROSI|nr:hypothetical protein K2173_022065 [Erythroxylum novogranatense]
MASKSRSYHVSATPVTVFAHLFVVAVTILVLVWLLHFRGGLAFRTIKKYEIINVHILLMVVGFILVAGEAILALKRIPATRRVRKAGHGILQVIALIAGIVGVYAAFKYKHESGREDMISLHSWLGMCTVCLFGLQWLLGFFSFVFPGAQTSSRASYLPWHIFGGLFIFFLAICTAETGLLERFNTLGLGHNQEGLLVNFTGLLLILFALAVGFTILLPHQD